MVFAPQATRRPPLSTSENNGCVLACCSRSCAEMLASAASRPTTMPMDTMLSPIGYIHEPPYSRHLAPSLRGQPMVCTTRSSGLSTSQTSFTPIS